MTSVQGVAPRAASVQRKTPVRSRRVTPVTVRPLPFHQAMGINRRCPECIVGMGLARVATISPTNGIVVLLWCQLCEHEWEVEEERPLTSSPDNERENP